MSTSERVIAVISGFIAIASGIGAFLVPDKSNQAQLFLGLGVLSALSIITGILVAFRKKIVSLWFNYVLRTARKLIETETDNRSLSAEDQGLLKQTVGTADRLCRQTHVAIMASELIRIARVVDGNGLVRMLQQILAQLAGELRRELEPVEDLDEQIYALRDTVGRLRTCLANCQAVPGNEAGDGARVLSGADRIVTDLETVMRRINEATGGRLPDVEVKRLMESSAKRVRTLGKAARQWVMAMEQAHTDSLRRYTEEAASLRLKPLCGAIT